MKLAGVAAACRGIARHFDRRPGHGGFCEVTHDSLTVLAEKADDVAAMKADDIKMHLETAEAVLADKYADDETRQAAHHAITHLNSLTGLPD